MCHPMILLAGIIRLGDLGGLTRVSGLACWQTILPRLQWQPSKHYEHAWEPNYASWPVMKTTPGMGRIGKAHDPATSSDSRQRQS